MKNRPFRSPPERCPVCGDDVPPKAWACPTCGSDYETGWSEQAADDALDLPDTDSGEESDFDYDDFVRNEFGDGDHKLIPKGLHPIWWITAFFLILLLALGWISI